MALRLMFPGGWRALWRDAEDFGDEDGWSYQFWCLAVIVVGLSIMCFI